MCPRVPVAADRHRNNEYPVLRQVADPVYPRERRPCSLDVDEQALVTHCRLHTAREICSHQQHNHTSVEDVVAFCSYLKNYHRNLQQGGTSQLLVLCNRTAVHNLLLQHGFHTMWYGGLRVSTTSSAAGATARIAVIVQTGCGFLSGVPWPCNLPQRQNCYNGMGISGTFYFPR